jgi:hypothetical protein
MAPTAVGFPLSASSSSTHPSIPAAAAVLVDTNATVQVHGFQ